MDEIILQLKKSRRLLVASHSNPDGDAIGSLLAMGATLEVLGKETVLYNESPMPAVYRFLPTVERVVNRIEEGQVFDTAVILDCGDLGRIGEEAKRVERIPVIINIDHHVTNSGFGHYPLIDPEACATSEILWRLIDRLQIQVDTTIATAIYTGILTDTGSFRFSNTNRAAFSICEKMVSLGVDPYKVAKQVYGTYSLGRIKLLNLALDSIELAPNGKLSWMFLSRRMLEETSTRPEDTDGLINYARSIEDVKVAALIQESVNGSVGPNGRQRYHVSLRSDGTVDVSQFAAGFGGGGHTTAAGFSVELPLAMIRMELIRLADRL
jgi:phosphoesterase RecJ-like protein